MVILQYMLVLLGCIYIITQSAICAPLRKLVSRLGSLPTTLIYCPACTGFWVGGTLAALGMWPFEPDLPLAMLQSSISACGLGALWAEYGPSTDIFTLEQGYDNSQQKEESYGEDKANS